MVEGFIKKFFDLLEKKTNTWLWNKILKPLMKLLIGWMPPYKDDM